MEEAEKKEEGKEETEAEAEAEPDEERVTRPAGDEEEEVEDYHPPDADAYEVELEAKYDD